MFVASSLVFLAVINREFGIPAVARTTLRDSRGTTVGFAEAQSNMLYTLLHRADPVSDLPCNVRREGA